MKQAILFTICLLTLKLSFGQNPVPVYKNDGSRFGPSSVAKLNDSIYIALDDSVENVNLYALTTTVAR
jgi:hypothetical protein